MQVPPLKLTLGNTEGARYCGGNVTLGITEEPVVNDGFYSLFEIPLAKFGCTGRPRWRRLMHWVYRMPTIRPLSASVWMIL